MGLPSNSFCVDTCLSCSVQLFFYFAPEGFLHPLTFFFCIKLKLDQCLNTAAICVSVQRKAVRLVSNPIVDLKPPVTCSSPRNPFTFPFRPLLFWFLLFGTHFGSSLPKIRSFRIQVTSHSYHAFTSRCRTFYSSLLSFSGPQNSGTLFLFLLFQRPTTSWTLFEYTPYSFILQYTFWWSGLLLLVQFNFLTKASDCNQNHSAKQQVVAEWKPTSFDQLFFYLLSWLSYQLRSTSTWMTMRQLGQASIHWPFRMDFQLELRHLT